MIGPGFAEAVIGEMFKRALPWLIAIVLILFAGGVAVGWLI